MKIVNTKCPVRDRMSVETAGGARQASLRDAMCIALLKPSGLMRSVEKMMQAFGCIPYGMHPAEPSCILPSDSFLTE
jgi:hypothetical protein